MNRKQLIKLLVVFLIVGGIGVAAYVRNNNSWKSETSSDKKLLSDFNINDVSHIVLKKNTNEVNLEKKNDVWVVRERNNYPANFETIRDFVQKTHDAKVVQTEPIGESQLGRMELLPPGKSTNSGEVVELKGAGEKTFGSFIMGKYHVKPTDTATAWGGDAGGWPDGRYVLTDDHKDTVRVISEAFRDMDPKPAAWINKDFLHIEKPKTVTFVSTNSANSWKATRDTESSPWKLVDAKPGEQVDTNKLSGLGYVMSSGIFNDIAVNPKPEESGFEHPLLVTIETFDHFTYTLKIGRKNEGGDHYFTLGVSADFPKERTPGKDEKKEDKEKLDKEFKDKTKRLEDKLKKEKTYENWVYMLPGFNVDACIQARSALMQEKKDEKTAKNDAAEPTEIK